MLVKKPYPPHQNFNYFFILRGEVFLKDLLRVPVLELLLNTFYGKSLRLIGPLTWCEEQPLWNTLAFVISTLTVRLPAQHNRHIFKGTQD